MPNYRSDLKSLVGADALPKIDKKKSKKKKKVKSREKESKAKK